MASAASASSASSHPPSSRHVAIDDHYYLGAPEAQEPSKVPVSVEDRVLNIASMSAEARKVTVFMEHMHPGEIFNEPKIILLTAGQTAVTGAAVGAVAGVAVTLVVSAPTGELAAPLVALGVVPTFSLIGGGIGGIVGLVLGIRKVINLGKQFKSWQQEQSSAAIKRFNSYFANDETLSICRFMQPCFDENIGFGIYQFPVFDECRVPHTFEYSEIENHLKTSRTCPISRQSMSTQNLHADYVRIGKIYAAYQKSLKHLSAHVDMNAELRGGIKALRDDMNEKCDMILKAEETRLMEMHKKGTISRTVYGRKIQELSEMLDPEVVEDSIAEEIRSSLK